MEESSCDQAEEIVAKFKKLLRDGCGFVKAVMMLSVRNIFRRILYLEICSTALSFLILSLT